MRKAIILDDKDNVATAIADLQLGETVVIQKPNGIIGCARIEEAILLGHKFACENIPFGGMIVKYGEIIGRATSNIGKGTPTLNKM